MIGRKLLALTMLLTSAMTWQPATAQPAPATEVAAEGAGTTPSGKVVTMDRITVEVVGDEGPDAILVPGLSTPRDVWDGVAASLKGRARLHLVQINGFDGSESAINAGGGILQGVADEIAAYARDNSLDQVALIGHSLGGTVALLTAMDHPERYGKVMVVDTLPFLTLLFDPGATAHSAEPMAERMKEMMAAAPQGKVDPASLRGMSITQPGLDQVQDWVAISRRDVSAEAMKEMLTLDLRPRLAALKVPMTLVYPQSDRALSLYADLYEPVPDHKLEGIENTGHFIMLDQAEAFEAIVESFLMPR